jgi:O-antigen ligase
MTQSRGGILALGFFGAWAFARMKRRARMLPLILAVGLVVVIFAPSDVWDRLKNLGAATSSGQLKEANDQGSAEQRFEIWKVASAVVRDQPFTGVGLGAYSYAHARYSIKQVEGFKRTARGQRDAHSTYLTALAETGIPGFLCWISIFIIAFRKAQAARRLIKHSAPDTEQQIFFAQSAMMAFGVAAIFGSYTNFPYTYINAAILYCLATVAIKDHKQRFQMARR